MDSHCLQRSRDLSDMVVVLIWMCGFVLSGTGLSEYIDDHELGRNLDRD
jgi:hypothetical protein